MHDSAESLVSLVGLDAVMLRTITLVSFENPLPRETKPLPEAVLYLASPSHSTSLTIICSHFHMARKVKIDSIHTPGNLRRDLLPIDDTFASALTRSDPMQQYSFFDRLIELNGRKGLEGERENDHTI